MEVQRYDRKYEKKKANQSHDEGSEPPQPCSGAGTPPRRRTAPLSPAVREDQTTFPPLEPAAPHKASSEDQTPAPTAIHSPAGPQDRSVSGQLPLSSGCGGRRGCWTCWTVGGRPVAGRARLLYFRKSLPNSQHSGQSLLAGIEFFILRSRGCVCR